jgi:TusE/DsrC/DsvC family sulfur relay protein
MNNDSTKTELDCDEDGFLVDPSRWDHAIAEQLAGLHDFNQLDEIRWTLIDALRQYYLANQHLPMLRHICHTHDLGNNCMNVLFENHGIEAWRIAGLPNPGEEAKSYM